MRVGIHLQSLRPGEIGGLEDYVRQLLMAVARLEPEITFVLFAAEYNLATFADDPRLEKHLLSAEDFAALDAERLAAYGLDLWFCPLLVLEPPDPGLPTVVTMPDLQHEVFPQFFSEQILEWRRHNYRLTVEKADRILTFSNDSKQQIVTSLGADPERVVVTYLDAAAEFESAAEPDQGQRGALRARYRDRLPEAVRLAGDYLFYPGAAWPHKNHRLLFEALVRLSSEHGIEPHLVLTGAQVEGAADLEQSCRDLGLDDRVHFLGYVPREDMPLLYAGSLATVFPSLFEGFGIPVVEAMRAGSPVICSSAASLPEVGGQAALYFDPQQVDELVDRLRQVWTTLQIESPRGRAAREELQAAGFQQAQQFSWQQTAATTLEVFRAVGASHRNPPETDSSADASTAAAEALPAASQQPLITVVTPSFNQQAFIERTVRSVLDNGYPSVEHWVVDGDSTDGTVATLEQLRQTFPDRLHFVSEPDRGQAHAVNKGFDRASGEIVGWLNSDDTYEPGCLQAVAAFFAQHPECDAVYGRAHYVDENDQLLGVYPTRTEFDWQTLAHECFICQPTVFLRRRLLDRGLRLDDSLQMCMDYDFWIRLGRDHQVRFLDQVLASSRMYEDNKTLARRSEVYREVFLTVKRHYGRLPFSWALGRAHHVWDHGDPFFNIRRLTWVTYLIALFFLLRHNWSNPRDWRNLAREVWVPLRAKLQKRWRALSTRDSTT
ncbi:MAG: glycosyltransferase [Acidobacteriota bacterium]